MVVCTPLGDAAVVGSLFSTCASAVETGFKFVEAEAGLGPASGVVTSAPNATLPGDITSDGTVVQPPPGPPPQQEQEEEQEEEEEGKRSKFPSGVMLG